VIPNGCVVRCPACSHRGWSVDKSESTKKEWLQQVLRQWPIESVRGIRGDTEDRRWYYRNKVCLRAEWKSGEWAFGVRRRKEGARSHHARDYEVIDIRSCPVHSHEVKKVLEHISRALPGPDLLPLCFVAISGKQLTLVLKAADISEATKKILIDRLRLVELGLEGLHVNLNPSTGNRVFSSGGWRQIWGVPFSRAVGGGMYGPNSFQQLIPALYEDALRECVEFFGVAAGHRILDLCSGTGASIRRWRGAGAETLGVELGGESVRCADEILGEGSVLRGRVSERLPQLEAWGPADFVFANPPRLGLEEGVPIWIAEVAKPQKIAYLSCSAGTLARDLSLLSNSGYGVRRIIPYDFFPQTHHIEVLALLERGGRDSIFRSSDLRSSDRDHGR